MEKKKTSRHAATGTASPMPLGPAASEGVNVCHNLRAAAGGGLEAAPAPAVIAPAGMRPLTMLYLADGSRRLILSAGIMVYAMDPDTGTDPAMVAELSPGAVVRSAMAEADGIVTLFTTEGPFKLRYDMASGSWRNPGFVPRWPHVVIRSDDHAELSARIDPFTLSGLYPHCSEPVSAADRAAATSRLTAAVESITASASAAGRCIHPRLMSYRLIDPEGRCIYRSVPVWVGKEGGGFGLCAMVGGDVTRQDGGKCAVGAITLTAPAFKAVVEVPRQLPGDFGRDVALLEILASPQITPYRPDLQAGCRLRAVDQSSGRFEAYIPGASNGMMPATRSRMDAVEGVLERFWECAEVVASVPYPFGGGFGMSPGSLFRLPAPAGMTAASAASALGKLLASKLPDADATGGPADVIRATIPPHAFVADTVLDAADMTAYSGISLLRGRPPHAAELAAGHTEAMTEADAAAHYVAVAFDDGSGDVAVTSDTDAAEVPVAIGPVTVYPDPAAARLTVAARGANGAVSRLSVPLRRSQSGAFAYHIDPELKPVPMVADGAPLVIPPDNRRPRAQPGVVAVARSSDPLALLVAARASAACVHRIIPAVRSSSSWDFGRQHLLLFAADGICSLSVDARRRSAAVNLLHAIGVARPDAVAATPGGIYAVLATGELVCVTGSRIHTVCPDSGAVAAAWCAPKGELWLAMADGSVMTADPVAATSCTRTFGPVLSFHDTGGIPLAVTADGICDLSRDGTPESVDIGWSVRMPVPYGARPRRLSVDMQSSAADITVSLRADSGAGASSSLPVTALRLKGPVNAPVRLRLAAPHRRWLTLALCGTAAPGTSISRWAVDME